MLTISALSKAFAAVQALDGLSLDLRAGELVGLVGASGAGKSTTMRLIMGSLAPNAGTLTWMGRPIDAAARRRFGYMPQERGLYPRMTAVEQLTYLARIHGLGAQAAAGSAATWIERLGLEARRGEEIQRLSPGDQQRVQLAAALVADPQLLILDEPFSGADPLTQDIMSQVLHERARAGVPALLSSHRLESVERLCDRVAIIRQGRLVADGTVAQLRASTEPRWRAVVEPAPRAIPHDPSALASLPHARAERSAEGRLVLTAGGPDEQALLAVAQRLGTVRELGPVRRPLDEIFREALAAPHPDKDSL